MITVRELRSILKDYEKTCTKDHISPSKFSLSKYIGVSVSTVYRAIRGMYNGIRYSNKPCNRRCFDNGCFDVLREFFGER